MTSIEYIEKAWKAYKNNFWSIATALILQIVITSIPFIIGLLPWAVIFLNSGTVLTQTAIANLFLSHLGVLSFTLIMFLMGLLTSVVLNGGFVRMLYEALRGRTRYETMFKTAKEKFWTILCANLLVLLIFLLILAALFAPLAVLAGFSSFSLHGSSILNLFVILSTAFVGLVVLVLVSIFFVFVNQAIVIDNLKAVQAVKKSFETAEKNFFGIFFLFLLFFIFNNGLYNFSIIGSLLVWLVTMPLLLISYTAFYVENRKRH